jgi:predicted phage terminase large subunit-like protein
MNERYRPLEVLIEAVASQEYLAQDAERYMPVRRVERTKEKVSRAYWLQPFFENGQILFPAKHLQHNVDDWQALTDELILFPQAEHDDLFDALQTVVEGAMQVGGQIDLVWAVRRLCPV